MGGGMHILMHVYLNAKHVACGGAVPDYSALQMYKNTYLENKKKRAFWG